MGCLQLQEGAVKELVQDSCVFGLWEVPALTGRERGESSKLQSITTHVNKWHSCHCCHTCRHMTLIVTLSHFFTTKVTTTPTQWH